MLPHFRRTRACERSLQTAHIGFSYSALVSVFAFRLLPYGLSVTSGAVSKALSNDALKRPFGALYIVHTKANAVAIAEVELSQIAMQMLLFAMLIDAFTDTVRHEPSCLQGDAQGPMKLIAANALLAGAKQVHRLQPKPHRNVAILKYGSDLHGKGLAALVALIDARPGAFALQLADAIDTAAMRANRAIGPTHRFKVLAGFAGVLELWLVDDRVCHDFSPVWTAS